MQNGTKPETYKKNRVYESDASNSVSPFPKNKSNEKCRQSVEAIGLLLFQLVSLATTLNGAKLLFGDEKMPFVDWLPIAYVLGFGVQLLLASILIINAFEDKPVRRLIALLLLSALSIYTNFFSIYNLSNGQLLEENASVDLARRKYGNLVTYFYTNPKNELAQLEQKAATLKCRLFQEDPEGTLQPKGCPNLGFNQGKGDKYNEYKAKFDSVNDELMGFNKEYIEDTAPTHFAPSIVEGLQDKKAKEIFDRSQKALKDIPAPILNKAKEQGYKADEYDDVTDFFPEQGTSYYLIPGQKVFTSKENRETAAVVAFIVAAIIDGISLWLGARLNGFYTSLKGSLGSINPIADLLNGSFVYLENIGKSLVPYMEAPLMYVGKIWFSLTKGGGAFIISTFDGFAFLLGSLISGLFGLFKHTYNSLRDRRPGKKLRLERKNGDGVEFLDIFYNAIVKGKSELLEEDPNKFQSYQALVSDMKAKGYFEDRNATNKDRPNSDSGSRPPRFDRANRQPDLMPKLKSKKAFHNWYVEQRNIQQEKQLSSLGDGNLSSNTIDFPPDI